MRKPPLSGTAFLAAATGAAALLRLPALRGDLWLDEVWSLRLARGAGSLRDVLFGIHHDNSTLLNTLWLWLWRAHRDPALLRSASLAAGLATVALLARDREDASRGRLAAALSVVSLPMILYSTEARGYAALAFFAVLGWRLMSAREPMSRTRTAALAAVCALGMFAHPLFVCALAAFAAWSWVREPRERRLMALSARFAPSAVLFGLYLCLQDGPTTFGAGAMDGFFPVLSRALASWSGAPMTGPGAVPGALAVLGLCGAELVRLARARDDRAVFFGTLFAADAAFVAAFPFRYERHFFLCLPFALLLAAGTLARLLRGRVPARAAAVALLAPFVAGNAAGLRALARDGRGHYRAALERMARDTAGPVVTVASDHDFRNRMLVEYHAAAVPAKSFDYLAGDAWGKRVPEWYLLHSFATDPRTAPVAVTLRGGGGTYRFVAFYPYGGLSGWSWSLYRRGP